jgi:tetratricopeptide (TPR) repeat protein
VLREHAGILCQDDHADAGAAAREALAAALAAGDEQSFADAAACMIEAEDEAGRDIEVWMDLAESALTRSADDPILARLLAQYGNALRKRGRMQAAFDAHRRALELRRRHADERPDLVGEALYTLGTTHLMAEQMDAGVPLIAEALAVWRDTLGPDHPNNLQALRTLAVLHYRRGELDEATDMVRRLLAAQIKLHGPDHPRVGDAHNMLSSVLVPRGAFAEARPHLEAALAIARTNTGQRRKLAYALANLANLEIVEGHLDVAEPLLDEATRELTAVSVPPHPDLVPPPPMNCSAKRRGDPRGALVAGAAPTGHPLAALERQRRRRRTGCTFSADLYATYARPAGLPSSALIFVS